MDQFSFAMLSLFGLPAALIGAVFLGHWLMPKAVWFGRPVQAVATTAVLAAIGAPIAVVMTDSEGEYYDDAAELVGGAFALPDGVSVNHQRDRTVRLGDCWRNAVNWRSDVEFPSQAAFDDWYAAQDYSDAVLAQIADYYAEDPARITVMPGALDLRERDPAYQLIEDHTAFEQNRRILEFYEPFVCTAIDRGADGALSLRPCDPVAAGADLGNQGWVIINPSAKDRTLEGRIYYASGPHYCTNPVRRAVNTALGLPHPKGGKPNTSMSGVLPIR